MYLRSLATPAARRTPSELARFLCRIAALQRQYFLDFIFRHPQATDSKVVFAYGTFEHKVTRSSRPPNPKECEGKRAAFIRPNSR
jgi:hypothetical protein